ncbi:hypothetical protein GNF76_26725 [Pseudomonas sp. CCM 7893]|uniref:Lipoprotein n=1 Tax=Pseudomonas spelaei TaxID=1055469 RepID=A0A6I3WJM6_9PSED|nr:hypothetical protein [Pseudomonas spelaei]MUF07944.1 hypothetical protein [Pseudomonas spelaei]
MTKHFITLSLFALIVSCADQTTQAHKRALDSSRNPDMSTRALYHNGAFAEKELAVRYGRYILLAPCPTQISVVQIIIQQIYKINPIKN